MSSKKLDSILRSVPSATSTNEQLSSIKTNKVVTKEHSERIVAVIPSSLKRQIKQYIVDHPGETEKTVLVKGLLALGFTVDEEHLLDKRGKK